MFDFLKKKKKKIEEGELEENTTVQSPDESGLQPDDREAIEAIKKFTDEDDLGEISVKSILGGDFLMSRFVMKQVLFVMFCVVLMIIYTANRYDSQQDAILIDSLRLHLQEVKYNVLTQSSQLMNSTRQSNIEDALRNTNDSSLHNPITPPFLIRVGEGRNAADEKINEVLVDSVGVDTVRKKMKVPSAPTTPPMADAKKESNEQAENITNQKEKPDDQDAKPESGENKQE